MPDKQELASCKDNHDNFSPCPFCGSLHIHHESMRGCRWARCQGCSATGGYVFDFQEGISFSRMTVVDRWNKRTVIQKEALNEI